MIDILTLSNFAQKKYRNRIAQSQNSYIVRQSENSYFSQDNSGIVTILTLRRTNIYTMWREKMFGILH